MTVNFNKGNISPAGCIICIVLGVIFLPVIVVALIVVLVIGLCCRIFGIKSNRNFPWNRFSNNSMSSEKEPVRDVPASEEVIDVEAIAVEIEKE